MCTRCSSFLLQNECFTSSSFPFPFMQEQQTRYHSCGLCCWPERRFCFAAAGYFSCSAWRTPAWRSIKDKTQVIVIPTTHIHTFFLTVPAESLCNITTGAPLSSVHHQLQNPCCGVVWVSLLHVSSFLTYTWLSCIRSKMIAFMSMFAWGI